VAEAWIEEATSFHISNGDNAESDWAQGYGYQFWRCRHNAYRGDGAFGQYCIVMPEQDAVLAMTGGVDDMQKPLNLLWEILLPAMHEDKLPDDAAAQNALTKKLSGLTLLPLQGESSSPTAARVSGQTYRVDDNALKIETIALDFTASGSTVSLQTARGEQTIPCGYGLWQHGQTTLFNEPWLLDPEPVVASGVWTAEDTFTMVVRLYETPFFHTLVYHFAGDEIMIEMSVNVSFGPLKAPLMVARLAK
jgi:hypothetical protein